MGYLYFSPSACLRERRQLSSRHAEHRVAQLVVHLFPNRYTCVRGRQFNCLRHSLHTLYTRYLRVDANMKNSTLIVYPDHRELLVE